MYRSGASRDAAIEELRRCAGTHFDPRVVEALIEVLHDAEPGESREPTLGLEVDRYEARAVFVSVADGMLAASRRLGGPRLTANLESAMAQWFAGHQPAFSLGSGHVSVHWDRLAGAEDELGSMRASIAQLGDLMAEVTGRSLVDHFYGEAVESLTDRLRPTTFDLALYRRTT